MSAVEWLCIGLAVALGLLLVLAARLLRLLPRLQALEARQAELAARLAALRHARAEQEQALATLHTALRAERAHVQQLQRKNQLLALLLDQLPGQSGREP